MHVEIKAYCHQVAHMLIQYLEAIHTLLCQAVSSTILTSEPFGEKERKRRYNLIVSTLETVQV